MSGFQKTPTNPHQEKKIPVDRTMRWSSLIANLQPFCLKSRSCAPKRRRSWFWDPWVFSRVLNDGRTSGAKISRWDTDGYRDEFVLFVMFIHPMADYLRIICIHNYTTYNYICIYFYIQHVTCLYMFVMVSVHIYIYIWYMSLQLKDDMSTNPKHLKKPNRPTGGQELIRRISHEMLTNGLLGSETIDELAVGEDLRMGWEWWPKDKNDIPNPGKDHERSKIKNTTLQFDDPMMILSFKSNCARFWKFLDGFRW